MRRLVSLVTPISYRYVFCAAPILLRKSMQMRAVPAMRCIPKNVPLDRSARPLCGVRFRNTFTWRRLYIFFARQH